MRQLVHIVLLLWVGFSTNTIAAEFVDTVADVKRAIFPIGTFLRIDNPSFTFRGTGFVVGNGNLIATNSHVVADSFLTDGRDFAVLIKTDQDQGKIRHLRVIARDDEHDLALLRIEGPPLSDFLRFEDASDIREGQVIAFTGFPIGGILGFSPVTHRGIVSAITPITLPGIRSGQLSNRQIVQLKRRSFNILQLDATAYPGSSGSPVYNPETGKVVAVLNMVFVKGLRENALSTPSGISYAIPIHFLSALIRSQ
jgi:S1-C subfamily serine protease